jgi:hypothetical protein
MEEDEMGAWIMDWTEISDSHRYIACAIGKKFDGSYYLYRPAILEGWQVKRLLGDCYAAMEMPVFDKPKPQEGI